jgi:hypothetical protein
MIILVYKNYRVVLSLEKIPEITRGEQIKTEAF